METRVSAFRLKNRVTNENHAESGVSSVLIFPTPCPLNEAAMPPSSNPPSYAEAEAAAVAGASSSRSTDNNTPKITPTAVASNPSLLSLTACQSAQDTSSVLERHGSVSRVNDTRRHSIVFESDDGGELTPVLGVTPAVSGHSITTATSPGDSDGDQNIDLVDYNATVSCTDPDISCIVDVSPPHYLPALPTHLALVRLDQMQNGYPDPFAPYYASLQREFTNPSLVPTPLGAPRSRPVQETSQAGEDSTSTESEPEPALAAGVNDNNDGDRDFAGLSPATRRRYTNGRIPASPDQPLTRPERPPRPADGVHSAIVRGQLPSFASSQVLPMPADTANLIRAHEAARGPSPPPSPSPSPTRRERERILRRHQSSNSD